MAALFYSSTQAQVSFGVKMGGATLPFLETYQLGDKFDDGDYYESGFNDSKTLINSLRNNTRDTTTFKPGVNFFTSGEELLAEVDSFAYVAPNRQPFNIEAALYMSVPISQRSRLRLEVAYHTYNLQISTDYTGIGTGSNRIDLNHFRGGINPNLPDSLYHLTMSSLFGLGSTALINTTPGRFIRPSLHYHYYLSQSFAFNIGASLSLALRNMHIQGFYHGLGRVRDVGSADPSYFQLTGRIDQSIGKNVAIPGLNAGFLFKIRGLPKIEIRGSYYAPTLLGEPLINFEEREVKLPSIAHPLKYRPHLDFENSILLSLFIEL